MSGLTGYDLKEAAKELGYQVREAAKIQAKEPKDSNHAQAQAYSIALGIAGFLLMVAVNATGLAVFVLCVIGSVLAAIPAVLGLCRLAVTVVPIAYRDTKEYLVDVTHRIKFRKYYKLFGNPDRVATHVLTKDSYLLRNTSRLDVETFAEKYEERVAELAQDTE